MELHRRSAWFVGAEARCLQIRQHQMIYHRSSPEAICYRPSPDSNPCQSPASVAQDDAEGALEQPLVSVSVGCDAVFLIGGAHRDMPPTALLLRSGDVVVMAGARIVCSRQPGHLLHSSFLAGLSRSKGQR